MTPAPPSDDPLATLLGKLEAWTRQGSLAQARDLEARLTARAGDDPRFWRGLGEVRLRLGQPNQAVAAARRWLAQDPQDTAAAAALARALALAGLWAEAADVAEAGAEAGAARGPLALSTRLALAGVLLSVGRAGQALALARPALDEAPDDPGVLYLLATCERQVGDFQAASRDVEAALSRDPEHGDALWIRSDLRRATPDRNHVADLRARLSARPDAPWAAQALYALGKELEQLGAYDEAFDAFADGAARVQAQEGLDPEAAIARVEELAAARAPSAVAQGEGDPSAAPIFVVGLPRSGTSLVERILGAHPQTAPLGEPPAFERAMSDLSVGGGKVDPQALGQAYLRIAGVNHGRRLIDKRPLNMLHVAEIVAALPRARVVLVERDLRDCGWAAFKTLFNEDAYPWSYAQEPLGRYLRAHAALGARWRDRFPDAVLPVRYEDVVRDLEGQALQLLAFCGLEWNDACLRFHENAAPATSASAVQVRRPVYDDSVGLWRRYAPRLQPMLEVLERTDPPVAEG